MQRIEATLPLDSLEEVMNTILDLRLQCQMTATEVRYADGKLSHIQQYRGVTSILRWVRRARLEIVVSNKEAEGVVGVLVGKLDRGGKEDSAVLITEVDDAVRIRTGRRGEFAF